MTIRRLLVTLAAALLFVSTFALGGCSSVAEQAAEELVEGATGVEVDDEGESITITGDEGETLEIEGSDSDLPDGFPSDMPVYDAEIEGTSKLSGSEGTAYYVALVSGDEFDAVAAWYKDELASSGWEIVSDSTVNVDGLSSALLAVKKGEIEGAMSIVQEEDGGSMITTNLMVP